MVDLNYTQLPSLIAALADADIVSLVDVSDTTDDPAGSQFKVTMSQLRGFISGRWADGLVATPGAYFLNEPGLGLYRVTTNIMGFANNGVQRGGVNSNGVFGGTGGTAAGLLTDTGVFFAGDTQTGMRRNGAQRVALAAGNNDALIVYDDSFDLRASGGAYMGRIRASGGPPLNYWDIQARPAGNSALLIATGEATAAGAIGAASGLSFYSGGSGLGGLNLVVGNSLANWGVQNYFLIEGGGIGVSPTLRAVGDANLRLEAPAGLGHLMTVDGAQVLVADAASLRGNDFRFIGDTDTGVSNPADGHVTLVANGNAGLRTIPDNTDFLAANGKLMARVRVTGAGGVGEGHWDIISRGSNQAYLLVRPEDGLGTTLTGGIIGWQGAGYMQFFSGDNGLNAEHLRIGGVAGNWGSVNLWALRGGDTGIRSLLHAIGDAGSQFDVDTAQDHQFTVNDVAILTIGATGVVSTVDVTAPNLIDGDATSDGTTYGRNNGAWVAVPTNYAPDTHVGSGGAEHADVIAAGAAGFMTGADKSKLDGIAAGAEVNTVDSVFTRTGAVVAQETDYEAFYLKPEMKGYSVATNAQAVNGSPDPVNIDVTATGQAQNLDMTAQQNTINFTNPPGGVTVYSPVVVHIRNGTAGALNFPTITGIDWGGATPPTTIAAGTRTAFTLHTIDDGTTWLAALIGEGYAA